MPAVAVIYLLLYHTTEQGTAELKWPSLKNITARVPRVAYQRHSRTKAEEYFDNRLLPSATPLLFPGALVALIRDRL